MSYKTRYDLTLAIYLTLWYGTPHSSPAILNYWRRKWQPTSVFLPRESPWTEEPGGLQSMGSQRVGHNWATKHILNYGPLAIWTKYVELHIMFERTLVLRALVCCLPLLSTSQVHLPFKAQLKCQFFQEDFPALHSEILLTWDSRISRGSQLVIFNIIWKLTM